MNDKRTILVASAVAALFAVACSSSDDSSDSTGKTAQAVKCSGINSCKGTSECQSSDGTNSCQGQNDCKGHGWVTVPSASECTGKGGTVVTGEESKTSANSKATSDSQG